MKKLLSDGTFFEADTVVVATGGLSYPSTGSTGDGYRFAAETGHKVVSQSPSLVPLVAKEDYVSKLFMKTTGMSLPNYIAERRIERAKEYLRTSSLPISKIAMEVGYGNFSYFSKTFRELVGCTPNEYRSRQK